MTIQFTVPPGVYKGSLHILTNTYIVFLIATILTGVCCYLIVALICISLMVYNIQHLFICLLAIPMSSLEKYSGLLAPFK